MMGWMKRARLALEQLQSHRYRVRRWTALEFKYPDGPGKAITKQRDQMRSGHEKHLDAAATLIGRKLEQLNNGQPCQVKRVGVKGKPQLLIELEIVASSEEEARRRAEYRIGRALQVKIRDNRNPPTVKTRDKVTAVSTYMPQQRTLSPPWGNCEVELLD